jgi:hypothetical protein
MVLGFHVQAAQAVAEKDEKKQAAEAAEYQIATQVARCHFQCTNQFGTRGFVIGWYPPPMERQSPKSRTSLFASLTLNIRCMFPCSAGAALR